MREYHDSMWGRPQLDSRELFAILCLESMACGLSWNTILKKEKAFRKAFSDFDLKHCANLSGLNLVVCVWGGIMPNQLLLIRSAPDDDVAELMTNPDIVRNRAKILAIRNNAQLALEMEQSAAGAFSRFVWDAVPMSHNERYLASGKHLKSHMRSDFKTKASERKESDGVHPTKSVAEFTALCRKKGFKFVGETTILSFWQAVGVVNHHAHDCFAFEECRTDERTAGIPPAVHPDESSDEECD
eukprot:m.52273 g.52273  ORF g.52273 m.52273 type:complete len:243 (+) comp6681_c0_seq2:346-1074(+)